MLSAHFIGRLMPETKNSTYIRSLIHQCDNEGFLHNALVPLRHYLYSPGGPLKYTLEGHKFAIFGCNLTHDKRYVVSVSNRFLSWDISSSEICRDIDPRSDGMILGLALSTDDRFAAAFTTNNQLVIIDIMLGHYIKVERVSIIFHEFQKVADKSGIMKETSKDSGRDHLDKFKKKTEKKYSA